jgi:hypothetical protein
MLPTSSETTSLFVHTQQRVYSRDNQAPEQERQAQHGYDGGDSRDLSHKGQNHGHGSPSRVAGRQIRLTVYLSVRSCKF